MSRWRWTRRLPLCGRSRSCASCRQPLPSYKPINLSLSPSTCSAATSTPLRLRPASVCQSGASLAGIRHATHRQSATQHCVTSQDHSSWDSRSDAAGRKVARRRRRCSDTQYRSCSHGRCRCESCLLPVAACGAACARHGPAACLPDVHDSQLSSCNVTC